jgi:hypothetical protein
MVGDTYQQENFLDDLRAGQPERYYGYVYETYGRIFSVRECASAGDISLEGVLQKPTDRR